MGDIEISLLREVKTESDGMTPGFSKKSRGLKMLIYHMYFA